MTNARQADAIRRALDSVRAAKDALQSGMTPDVVLTEVEQAENALGELTGRTAREDMVARIFERFCVGKDRSGHFFIRCRIHSAAFFS